VRVRLSVQARAKGLALRSHSSSLGAQGSQRAKERAAASYTRSEPTPHLRRCRRAVEGAQCGERGRLARLDLGHEVRVLGQLAPRRG